MQRECSDVSERAGYDARNRAFLASMLTEMCSTFIKRFVHTTGLATSLAKVQAKALAIALVVALEIVAIGVGRTAGADGMDDDLGLASMHRMVDAACDCAQAHTDGMAAAMSCTKGLSQFGRLKIKYRGGWDDEQSQRAEDLEQVIESCVSNATSADAARDRLGMLPIRSDGSVPSVYWMDVDPRALRVNTSDLVRLRHLRNDNTDDAMTIIGVVSSVSTDSIELRLARRDGGGSERIAIAKIQQAWIMVVNGNR